MKSLDFVPQYKYFSMWALMPVSIAGADQEKVSVGVLGDWGPNLQGLIYTKT